MQLGIDQISELNRQLSGVKLALVTNNAATNSIGMLTRLSLQKAGFNLVKLFSPEHGISALADDGTPQPNGIDGITGLPIISLYGLKLAPTAEDLEDIDVVLYDLPDVGCRFYTFQWTLTHVMEACNSFLKPLIVFDRPNPLSGNFLLNEGPMMTPGCFSFIGREAMPIRHGLTVGEFARFWQHQHCPGLSLKVITLHQYNRNNFFSENGLPFVPPSPGIPSFETALLYPGMGLLEGISVSEGRGTTLPFRVCGAPFIDASTLCEALNQCQPDCVAAVPCTFVPSSGYFSGQTCSGIQLMVLDAKKLRPVLLGLQLIKTLMTLYPNHIFEKPYPTHANPTGGFHFDKLSGLENGFERIKALPIKQLPELINDRLSDWQLLAQPHLLYH